LAEVREVAARLVSDRRSWAAMPPGRSRSRRSASRTSPARH